MADFGYTWENKDCTAYSTRHMPRALLRRVKVLASQEDESVEFVLNQALDLGITQLERRGK